MEIQLRIIGLLFIALAMVHLIFPRYFHWNTELRNLSLVNRQMMEVHTFFIALTVLLMGLLCFTCSADLTGTTLGRNIALGLSLFWGVRFIFQFFVYSPRLWKGKIFETVVHVVFSVFWGYVTTVFLLVYLNY